MAALRWPRWLLSDPVVRMIVGCLLQWYPLALDRTRLVQALNIPRSTVFDAIQRLCFQEVGTETPQRTGQRGRPRTGYSLVYPASDRGPPGPGL